ncbi:MAG TPA: hypothetical protein VD965_14140 [Burkholderiales bacterium]|nr:hypothetical protein [Burkholderiales bacterium]
MGALDHSGESVQTRTLRKAAAILGGPEALAAVLDAPQADVTSWLDGRIEPPRTAFLLSVDIIVDELQAK